MSTHVEAGDKISRRSVLKDSALLLAGGVAGGGALVHAATAETPPPLPWKWVKLDPLEAGRRAYRFYKERGGCGTASYLACLSLLKEKVGHPWTTLPDMMMAHAAAGFGGHGTLCGALGGASTIINLVTYTGQGRRSSRTTRSSTGCSGGTPSRSSRASALTICRR